MNNRYIPIYIGFALMVIGLILQLVATGLTASLDKYAVIPTAYRTLMTSAVIVFFLGLAVVLIGTTAVSTEAA